MSRTPILILSTTVTAALVVGAVAGYQLGADPQHALPAHSEPAVSDPAAAPMTEWPEPAVLDDVDIPVPEPDAGAVPVYAPAIAADAAGEAGASDGDPAPVEGSGTATSERDAAEGADSGASGGEIAQAPPESVAVGLRESAVVGLAEGSSWTPTILVDPCASPAPPAECDEGVAGTVQALHAGDSSGSSVTVGRSRLLLEVTPYVSAADALPGTCAAEMNPARAVPLLILVSRESRLSATSRPAGGGESREEDLVVVSQREVDEGIEVCAYVGLPSGEQDVTILALEAAGPTDGTQALTVRVRSWTDDELVDTGVRRSSALLVDGFSLQVLSHFGDGQTTVTAAAPTATAGTCDEVRDSDETTGGWGRSSGYTGDAEPANAQWSTVRLSLLAGTDYTVCVALTDGSTVLEWERFLITTPEAYDIRISGFLIDEPPAHRDRFVGYLRNTTCPRITGQGSSQRRTLEDGQFIYNGHFDCTIDAAYDADADGLALVLGTRDSISGEWLWDTARLAAPVRCDAFECRFRTNPTFSVPLPGGDGHAILTVRYPETQEHHAGWVLSPPLSPN